MTLYTYLIERLEKYRSLNPIEFQDIESQTTTKLTYHIEQNTAVIDQYPFKIEFNDNSIVHGINNHVIMYNIPYKFNFTVIHESNIIVLARMYRDRGEYYHKLNPLIDWVCKIFTFEYRNDCFTSKSFQQ